MVSLACQSGSDGRETVPASQPRFSPFYQSTTGFMSRGRVAHAWLGRCCAFLSHRSLSLPRGRGVLVANPSVSPTSYLIPQQTSEHQTIAPGSLPPASLHGWIRCSIATLTVVLDQTACEWHSLSSTHLFTLLQSLGLLEDIS